MTSKTKIVDGVQCPFCKEAIWSRYRHDFRFCSCKKTFVDGGRDYLRAGGDILPDAVKIDTTTNEIVEDSQNEELS